MQIKKVALVFLTKTRSSVRVLVEESRSPFLVDLDRIKRVGFGGKGL